MLKNLWKDPVWSKVISTVIIAIGAFIISLIYSLTTKLSVKDSFLFLWNYKIELGPTLLIFFSLLFIYSIIKNYRNSRPSKKEKLKTLFHNKYRKIEDPSITYRFNAYVSSHTNFPFISDLRLYCKAHNTERLINKYNGCPIIGCTKYQQGYDEITVKEDIETYLLKEWEKMN